MGHRGKLAEQERARALRRRGWTYGEICAELGVSRSSVSLWTRDVVVDDAVWAARVRTNRRSGAQVRRPNRLAVARQVELAALREEGRRRIGRLTDRELLVAGTALYAGEGKKDDGMVAFANSDPRMVLFFVTWLRRFFETDETRLRVQLYLHEGLDLVAANRFWAELTDKSESRFRQAVPGAGRSEHPAQQAPDGLPISPRQLFEDASRGDGPRRRAAIVDGLSGVAQ